LHGALPVSRSAKALAHQDRYQFQRELSGILNRAKAQIAVLITLEEPTDTKLDGTRNASD
jgi:hypothetical protein